MYYEVGGKVIVYDLDGVLLPDVKAIFRDARHAMRPLFSPDKPFCILTGRPQIDKNSTILWMENNGIKPEVLYHDNLDIKRAYEYKLSVLKDMNPAPDMFVESDPNCVRFLKRKLKKTGIRVILFSDLVKGAIVYERSRSYEASPTNEQASSVV